MSVFNVSLLVLKMEIWDLEALLSSKLKLEIFDTPGVSKLLTLQRDRLSLNGGGHLRSNLENTWPVGCMLDTPDCRCCLLGGDAGVKKEEPITKPKLSPALRVEKRRDHLRGKQRGA